MELFPHAHQIQSLVGDRNLFHYLFVRFVENSLWRHVENLYAMFDHLRQEFPGVIVQNCDGGGRLDWAIMRRFDNTDLSDWLRLPRAVKILNGMTWVLAPGAS